MLGWGWGRIFDTGVMSTKDAGQVFDLLIKSSNFEHCRERFIFKWLIWWVLGAHMIDENNL